jgi:hypothetical protein
VVGCEHSKEGLWRLGNSKRMTRKCANVVKRVVDETCKNSMVLRVSLSSSLTIDAPRGGRRGRFNDNPGLFHLVYKGSSIQLCLSLFMQY